MGNVQWANVPFVPIVYLNENFCVHTEFVDILQKYPPQKEKTKKFILNLHLATCAHTKMIRKKY